MRIWTLESDNDAKAVKCLANKLVTHLQLEIYLSRHLVETQSQNEIEEGHLRATR